MAHLEPSFPAVNLAQLANIEENLERSLTPRQHWILSSPTSESSSSIAVLSDDEQIGTVDVADHRPNPEEQTVEKHQFLKLKKVVAALPADEALLLQLRFEQDLSLEEIARLTVLGDAQRVHRKLALILKKLRSGMV